MTRWKREREIARFLDLTYLDLVFNMREFEENDLPKMREVVSVIGCTPWLSALVSSTMPFLFETPKRSKAEIYFRDRCYQMWEEMDHVSIWIN